MSGSHPPNHCLSWVAVAVSLTCACAGSSRSAPQTAPTTRALLEAAENAEQRRDYLEAQSLYQRAKDAAPDDLSRARAARGYGRALAFYGEGARAARELEHAAALDPGDAGVWHDLGMVRHSLGDARGAEIAFDKAVHTAPLDARPRIALAALMMKQGRYRDALREYQAMHKVPLPPPVREKVEWAIKKLQGMLDRDSE